jgi:hypothetical protein
MKAFNFRKRIKLNDFTAIFGGAGRRRTLVTRQFKNRLVLRFTMKQIRRAHQGRKNKTFGMIQSLRIRRTYGRRQPTRKFIR